MAHETEDAQSIKAARNQALCREVNERIEEIAAASGDAEFLCECADITCIETVRLSIADYERIRSSPTRFPIHAGHDLPELENIVEINDRYAVVQKKGVAAAEAARLDPRSRG